MTKPPAILMVSDVLLSDPSENKSVYIDNNAISNPSRTAKLYKSSPNFSAESFAKHSSLCGIESRNELVSRSRNNLYERWQTVDQLQQNGTISNAEAESYKRLLEDMAQLIVGLNAFLENGDRVAYPIELKSTNIINDDRLRHIPQKSITSFSAGTTFGIFLSVASWNIQTLGAEINRKSGGSLNLAEAKPHPNQIQKHYNLLVAEFDAPASGQHNQSRAPLWTI